MSDVPAAWYDDPTGRHDHRYWDGTRWTEHVADLGVAAAEPYDGPAVPPRIEPQPEPEATAVEPTPEPTAVEPEPEPDPAPRAAWRAAPTEVAAPAAAAERASSEPKSSKRLIVVIALAALVAIVVVIVLLVAGGGSSRDSTSSAGQALSAQLAGRLRSANGFKAKDAECVSDYMVDHLHTSRLKGVDLTGEQVPAALQSDFAKALGDGVSKCKVSAPNLGSSGGGGASGLFPSGSTPALPTGPQDEATTKKLFVSFYQLTLGLDPTQAQCLADQMFDKLDAGKTSLGNAQDQLPDALKTCKIPADVLDKLAHS